MKAIWNQQIIAESDNMVIVESNHYFPMDAIQLAFFQASDTKTVCPWKGEASYFNVVVEGQTNADAAWYYPATKPKAKSIQGMVAFWRGVAVVE